MPKSLMGRKRKPASTKLVYAGVLYVTPARLRAMRATWRNTGQTVSQQAAAALDKADPLPDLEAGPD